MFVFFSINIFIYIISSFYDDVNTQFKNNGKIRLSKDGEYKLNRLKSLRTEKNLTQKQLGKKINVNDSTVAKYENEKASISDSTLVLLTEIFEVSSDYILGISDERNIYTKKDKDVHILKQIKIHFGDNTYNLLDKYLNLNDEGKKRVSDVANDLAEIDKYKILKK